MQAFAAGWLKKLVLARTPAPAPDHDPAPTTPEPPAAPVQDDSQAAENLVSHLYAPSDAGEVLARLQAAGFDPDAYYAANPDLAQAFPSARRAAWHFLSMVKQERRAFPMPVRPRALEDLAGLHVNDPTMMPALLASLGDAATATGSFPDTHVLESVWSALEAFGRLGGRPYLVIGDSHSTFYRRSTVRGRAFLLPFHVCCTGGSAAGLANPRSRSGYRQQLQALASLLTYLPSGLKLPILLQFGQVDLEFVHAFRRLRSEQHAFDRAGFEAFAHQVAETYGDVLATLFPAGRRDQVTILGVFPPAIGDAALARGYMNGNIARLEEVEQDADLAASLARLEWPDLATRTDLHRGFNAELSRTAERLGFRYADDFSVLTGGGPTLDPSFIPFGKGNEHPMDLAPTTEPLSDRLWRIVGDNPPLTFSETRRPQSVEERRARTITFADLSEQLAPDLLPPLDRPGVDLARLSPEQRSWRDQGVVELPGFLPDDLVDAYVARRKAAGLGPGGWAKPTPYLHVPELRALALYPPLMATMRDLLGEEMMLHLSLTGWASTERDWHQDDYLNPPFVASWYAAVWMALDDIGPDCGPFEYLPGSHRWPLLRLDKVKSFLTEEELARREPVSGANDWPKYAEEYVTPAVHTQIAEQKLPVKQFLGRKGDVLIWHGRLMHRGSLPRVAGKERRSLITHYSGAAHRPDMPERAIDQPTNGTYAVFDHPFV